MPRAQVSSKAAFQLKLVTAPEAELVELRDFCQAILVERKKAEAAKQGEANPPKRRRVSKAKAAAATAKAEEVTSGRKGKVYGTGPVAAPAAEVLT